MAGHSQFKNIMHRKGAQDAKRAKLFTKILRNISVAAKEGGADPEHNSKLRLAINAAKEANIPKDRVTQAIQKATNPNEADNFEEVRYEGYGPGQTALIVEALTDNRNRTASDVRSSFSKHGGNLGETGSVNFMFKRVGVIVYPDSVANNDEIFEATVEVGGDDCLNEDGLYEIICMPEGFNEVRAKLEEKFGAPNSAEVTWKPNSTQMLSVEDGEKLLKLLDALEDCDDVQNVIGNFELPPELLEKK